MSRWELSVLLKDTFTGHVDVNGQQLLLGSNRWKYRLFNHQARGRSDRHVMFCRVEVSGRQHSALPVRPGGVQLSNWRQMQSDNPLHTRQNACCFNAIRNSSFYPSLYDIWLHCFSCWCLWEHTELNIVLYFMLGSSHNFYFVNVWNQSMTKPITASLNFIWCGNLIECTDQNGRPVWLANY